MHDVRVIGLGNALAGDDALGVVAARQLARLPDIPADVLSAGMAGLDLVELMRGCRAVILIDAVRSGREAGTIHRLDASTAPLPSALFPLSTHALSVADAVELARALDALPPTVIVYGVELGRMAAGAECSPPVAAVLPILARRIVHEVVEISRTSSG